MANGSVEAARGRATKGAPPSRPRGPARSVLRGEVENVGLPTLLTILDMERRSGLLLIQRQGTLGRLHVRDGRVVRARIEGSKRGEGPATGTEAVYQMLSWPNGQFELWQAVVEGRDEVGASTTFLLMESARRTDEANGAVSMAGSGAEAW
jgi:hypothetical protein